MAATEKLGKILNKDDEQDRLALALLILKYACKEPLYLDANNRQMTNLKNLTSCRAALLYERFGALTQAHKNQALIKALPKEVRREWEKENGRTRPDDAKKRTANIERLIQQVNTSYTGTISLTPPPTQDTPTEQTEIIMDDISDSQIANVSLDSSMLQIDEDADSDAES